MLNRNYNGLISTRIPSFIKNFLLFEVFFFVSCNHTVKKCTRILPKIINKLILSLRKPKRSLSRDEGTQTNGPLDTRIN